MGRFKVWFSLALDLAVPELNRLGFYRWGHNS